MALKTNASKRAAGPPPENHAQPAPAPPDGAQERLQHIAALGQRINGYLEFMSGVGGLSGVSAEAKERAIAAFHERMVVLERQLARIQEELQLG